MLFASPLAALADDKPLVVHEWGTFTSLQDETGRTIAGINSDDEPVPPFCHSLRWDLILGNPSQGVPHSHPNVTMRLETPVMYFHSPDPSKPITLNVEATFRGGWITQYYPAAYVEAPGYKDGAHDPGKIAENTIGTIRWSNVRVGGESAAPPESNDHVWTTPRKVDSSPVTLVGRDGVRESEKYLFYRGVGHVDAPLIAKTSGDQIKLETPISYLLCSGYQYIDRAWLASFDADGSCRATSIDRFGGPRPEGIKLPDAQSLDLPKLRAEMKQALIKNGLFEDEAEAMLATWEVSYFRSPGLRVFYIVPESWVQSTLPLTFSMPVDLKRVMIGRLELITPHQRELLKTIANAPVPSKQMETGSEIEQAYEHLGRFRNALVLDELAQRPTSSLRMFVQLNDLMPFAASR